MTSTDREPVASPEIEIVDPHHHLWDRAHRWPGQSGDADQAPNEPNSPGVQDDSTPETKSEPTRLVEYLLPDLNDDISASDHRVVGTVYVECGWKWDAQLGPFAPVPEVAQVANLAGSEQDSPIQGIVGYADLRSGRGTGEVLDSLIAAGDGRLVGVRQGTTWHPDPRVPASRSLPGPRLTEDEVWRQGFAALQSCGLVFDSWVYQTQLKELADLAAAFPDTTIVIDHLGGPIAVGPFADRDSAAQQEWIEGLRACAERPNMVLKVGGLGMPMLIGEPRQLSSADLEAFWRIPVRQAIEIFGPDRCMLESDFPIDRVTCTYRAVWNAFKMIVEDASPSEKEALFAGTARRVYGLK